jgi:hypothetical protein
MEKRWPLQQMLLKNNWISTWRRLKLDPSLSLCTDINPKWIKDFNVRTETLKQLQKAVGNTWEHIGIGNDFLSRTQMSQHLRERMNKWDCIKLESLCTAKETVTKLKRLSIEWEENLCQLFI